jgi:hypothetical protein
MLYYNFLLSISYFDFIPSGKIMHKYFKFKESEAFNERLSQMDIFLYFHHWINDFYFNLTLINVMKH